MSGTGFDVTPGAVTRSGNALADLAGQLETALGQLRAATGGLDGAWGDSAAGTQIEQAYQQVSAQAFTAIESYIGQVGAAGQALPAGAQGFQGWDGEAGQRLSALAG
ncbi:MAG TPA: hypothetical protein VJT31_36655 [Rugosimonospora sp.]|nr:hypothetical protein [Rugosimonospora sp.]